MYILGPIKQIKGDDKPIASRVSTATATTSYNINDSPNPSSTLLSTPSLASTTKQTKNRIDNNNNNSSIKTASRRNLSNNNNNSGNSIEAVRIDPTIVATHSNSIEEVDKYNEEDNDDVDDDEQQETSEQHLLWDQKKLEPFSPPGTPPFGLL